MIRIKRKLIDVSVNAHFQKRQRVSLRQFITSEANIADFAVILFC